MSKKNAFTAWLTKLFAKTAKHSVQWEFLRSMWILHPTHRLAQTANLQLNYFNPPVKWHSIHRLTTHHPGLLNLVFNKNTGFYSFHNLPTTCPAKFLPKTANPIYEFKLLLQTAILLSNKDASAIYFKSFCCSPLLAWECRQRRSCQGLGTWLLVHKRNLLNVIGNELCRLSQMPMASQY